jgi:uncharacterized protein YjbI with pentapeptide repeats
MRKANLTDASMRGANLRDADLRGADLTRADLSGVDLSGQARVSSRPSLPTSEPTTARQACRIHGL